MTLFLYKVIAAILIFGMSIITILYPLREKNALKHSERVSLSEALASGIFLGVAFFHMLPDAVKLFNQVYPGLSYPVPEAICVAGFLLLLFLERISLVSSSPHAEKTRASVPIILTLMLTIHALVEGAALGIDANFSETSMLLIAILAHKLSESFALCLILIRYKIPTNQVIIIISLFSLMTPIGIFLGNLLNQSTLAGNSVLLAGIFNAFAAGTFLYISTLHHIHAHQHGEEPVGLQEFACLLGGVVVMASIAFWA